MLDPRHSLSQSLSHLQYVLIFWETFPGGGPIDLVGFPQGGNARDLQGHLQVGVVTPKLDLN